MTPRTKLKSVSRRELLRYLGIAGVTPAVSDTWDLTNLHSVKTGTQETNGTPKILRASATYAQQPAAIRVRLVAESQSGITQIRISSPSDEIQRTPDGQNHVAEETTLESPPGEYSQINFIVEDRTGGSTRRRRAYARLYPKQTTHRLQVGAVYMPYFNAAGDWETLVPGQPAVGEYTLREPRTLARHVDQMQGFGVTRMMLNYGGAMPNGVMPAAFANLVKRLDDSLPSSQPLEIMYVLRQAMTQNRRQDRSIIEQLEQNLSYIREEFLQRSNYGRYDNRPVVTFWNANYIAWGGNPNKEGELAEQVNDALLDEFGTWGSFVDYLRSMLTVEQTDPYLVADIQDSANGGQDGDEGYNMPQKYADLVRHFDAVTTWTGGVSTGETRWSTHLSNLKQIHKSTRQFATDHKLDFIPTVMAGFDDRANDRWGENRYVPRAPGHLWDTLALAERYRTVERVNVATFNDWAEGTQIEPGTFRDKSYGTDHLKRIHWFHDPTPRPVVGESRPNDPDGDLEFEDVNGDGEFDIVDVQALFENLDDSVVQNNPDAFDFNDDGTVNVIDVQRLFSMLS